MFENFLHSAFEIAVVVAQPFVLADALVVFVALALAPALAPAVAFADPFAARVAFAALGPGSGSDSVLRVLEFPSPSFFFLAISSAIRRVEREIFQILMALISVIVVDEVHSVVVAVSDAVAVVVAAVETTWAWE